MLVARALLRSEPFSTWGLRVSLFEEWAWVAWSRLEAQLVVRASMMTDEERCVGLAPGKSRLGRRLLSNEASCDFHGVDGKRDSLLDVPTEDRPTLKLPETESTNASKGSKKAVQEGAPPGSWPERLPRTATPRAMGACWSLLERAPMASPSSASGAIFEKEKGNTSEDEGDMDRPSRELPSLRYDDSESASSRSQRRHSC